jgi:hypothetical protein
MNFSFLLESNTNSYNVYVDWAGKILTPLIPQSRHLRQLVNNLNI